MITIEKYNELKKNNEIPTELEGVGTITSAEYSKLTDPKNKDWKKYQELKVWKYSKHELEEDGKGKIKVIETHKF